MVSKLVIDKLAVGKTVLGILCVLFTHYFQSFSEKIAIRKLKDFNWNVEIAVDAFFNEQPPTTAQSPWNRFAPSSPQAADTYKLTQVFQRYKGRMDGILPVLLTV